MNHTAEGNGMTLQQMQYILEIDRCGSMNKAAQDLFVSQSALSSAVHEIEKDLGITVFRRSNRGISLTEDGQELVAQIAPIVEQSRKLSSYYKRRNDTGRVHLSISAQRYPFCAKAFVDFLNSLGRRSLQLSLKETDMAAVIHDVSAGQSDLGILFLSDKTERYIIRLLTEKNLVFEPLITLKPHVFMRKDHPLSRENSLRLEQLRPFPHVVFTQSENQLYFAEEAVSGSGMDYEQMVYVSDRASIYNIMAHSDCVSTGSGVLPEGYADEQLIAVALTDSCDMRLGLVRQRNHTPSPAEIQFVEILKTITAENRE